MGNEKKRQVILGVIVITIMTIIGVCISNKIRQDLLEKYETYDKAAKITSQAEFKNAIKTNVGNAFVYGNLEALDSVTFPELEGEYSYIMKKMQSYQKHYRTVTKTHKDSKGKAYTTEERETYWTWDTLGTEERKAKKISFLNVEFDYGKIKFPSSHYISTIDKHYNRRNVYYGTDLSFTGTIYCYIENNTINKVTFYNQKNITETIEKLKSGQEVLIFWILWLLFTVAVTAAACYFGKYNKTPKRETRQKNNFYKR